MRMKFNLTALLVNVLLLFALHAANAQRKIEWFEPYFDSSYAIHSTLYGSMFSEEVYPVHYNSFRNKPVNDVFYKKITKKTQYNEHGVSYLGHDLSEMYIYNRHNYLTQYSLDYVNPKLQDYQVVFSYSKNRKTIVADYSNNSDYRKVIYYYDKNYQLIKKIIYKDTVNSREFTYSYNEDGLLTDVFVLYNASTTNKKIIKLTYALLTDRTREVEYIKSKLKISYDIKSNVCYDIRDSISQNHEYYIQGDNMVYSCYYDGSQIQERINSTVVCYVWKQFNLLSYYTVKQGHYTAQHGHGFTQLLDMIYSISANKKEHLNVWDITVESYGRKVRNESPVIKRMISFSYDNVKYTYEYF
ncbi:hypothetical protein CAP35_04645 [Chitinophagaceae bacterium IBVUCB1]|nr:hypothetical protein CAP35_04645 [Chitinophagaceae bacterium IBVUCB1]